MPPDAYMPLARLCAFATGMTLAEVVRIAEIGPKRYKVYPIAKRSGGQRIICHPSRELKALQYVFLRDFLTVLPIHESATAYKRGSSIKVNAEAHRSSRVILKLDFANFFPSIKVSDWEIFAGRMFPHWTPHDMYFSSHVLFWGEGGYRPRCLSIGAPTSPLISNAMLYHLDGVLTNYAAANGLTYTRYADDLTFSATGHLNKQSVIDEVTTALDALPYPRLKLNPQKTKLASKATSRRVTGLVLSNDGCVSLGRDRKGLISAMVHRALQGKAPLEDAMHLQGLLSFALDVEPRFVAALEKKYGKTNLDSLRPQKISIGSE